MLANPGATSSQTILLRDHQSHWLVRANSSGRCGVFVKYSAEIEIKATVHKLFVWTHQHDNMIQYMYASTASVLIHSCLPWCFGKSLKALSPLLCHSALAEVRMTRLSGLLWSLSKGPTAIHDADAPAKQSTVTYWQQWDAIGTPTWLEVMFWKSLAFVSLGVVSLSRQ